MAKQTFVADTILTAAQMNALQGNDYNQTVSTKTASYTLVAADAGTKIVMNSASATTITVNTSLFSAGDTLTILNIAAGVCTVTAGTATVSTTGTLALVQNAGGTLYFTSAGVSVFQANGVTASSGALTLTGSTTVSAAASCSVTSCFSATYDNYLVIANFTSVTGSPAFRLRTSSDDSTTNYGWTTNYRSLIGGGSGSTGNAYASSVGIGDTSLSLMNYQMTCLNPNKATTTNGSADVEGIGGGPSVYQWQTGYYINTSTQYTGITFLGTTLTGTARVYGYALS